jgi:hypothetical protein
VQNPIGLYLSSNIKEERATYTVPKEVEAKHIGKEVIRLCMAESTREQGVQPSALEIV